MLLDQLLDKRKTSTSKLFIAGIILVVILVLLGIFSVVYDTDPVEMTKQENFYGISGKILEVRVDSVIVETPVISYEGSSPLHGDRWIWTVTINSDTKIIRMHADENVPDTEHGDTPLSAQGAILMAINDLRADDLITITSATDIKKQFTFDDKHMLALKIEVY
jgi:hypothetical protein